MYRKILAAGESIDSIRLPSEWEGRRIEVIAFPVEPEEEEQTQEPEYANRYTVEELMNPQCLVGRGDPKRIAEFEAIFAPYMVSLKDFKFDRNEANNYD